MQTREQQIQAQAELSFSSNPQQAEIFAQGARWADYNQDPNRKIYVILSEIESDNEELKGLWLSICARFFTSRKQAEKYVSDNCCAFNRYNIIELNAEDEIEGIISKIQKRKP